MRWLLGLAVLLTMPMGAQDPFEAVVLSYSVYGCYTLPFTTPPTLLWAPNRFELNTDVRALASADGETVFALAAGGPMRIAKIAPGGFRTEFFNGPSDSWAQYIAVAPQGRVFVATSDSVTSISPGGAVERTFPIPGFYSYAGFFALAPDGCTLFYSKSSPGVGRINGCTGEALPDFATLPSYALDVQALSDGRLLVAHEKGVSLYDAGGALGRVVARMDWYGADVEYLYPQRIAVSHDGSDLWIAAMSMCEGQGILLRVSLTDGRELSRRDLGDNWAIALIAGASPASTVAVPATTPAMLLLMAAALASAALFLLRGSK